MSSLILVGGMPGSGKSTFANALSRAMRTLHLDKDSLCNPLTDRLLIALGSSANDRESDIYLNQVRHLEYEILISNAVKHVRDGRSVCCSAPFIKEFKDPEWIHNLRTFRSDMTIIPVWVDAEPQTTRKRIIQRKQGRDEGKLRNWDEYIRTSWVMPNDLPGDIRIVNNNHDVDPTFRTDIHALTSSIAASKTTPQSAILSL